MKKQLILASLVVFSVTTKAQQWTTSGSNIYNLNADNVGVGTSAPLNKLHVSSAGAGDGIRITQSGSGATGLHFNPSTGDLWSIYALGQGDGWGGKGDLAFQNQTRSTNPFFYIKGNTGNVGIGTTAPGSRLEVKDASYSRISVYTSSANKAGLWALNTQNSYGLVVDGSGVGHVVNNINGPEFNLINFQQTNSAPQVWIGNTKPQSPHTDFQFAVAGKVLAQSVYVTPASQWADYVFAPDYKLTTLGDVEKFYKENKHLPEIPSAKEVEEKGIDVGEMNTLLLKKVEELTLYMVDLNKKVEKLEAENKNLKGN